ncbi:hypothetical protein LR48_Vigan01g067900 [Vigna angularis]|uniref:Uncharacterized protein n=1 Tax=Phaseolus angularis TaxID=3914 RepID=A0A0L9TLU3_PHAAN|nr:hypothetical protein LR48_Vigan01g067900 [Vigna angularis]
MQFAAAQQPQHHQVALGEFDSKASSNNTYNSCKSGCTNYMGLLSSPASYESRRVQRSVSSHSLQKNSAGPHHPFSPLFARLLDSQNGSVRRACSTELAIEGTLMYIQILVREICLCLSMKFYALFILNKLVFS